MSVYVILEMNGYRPCVVGTECLAALKIVTYLFLELLLYIRKIDDFCKCIFEMKPYMCLKIVLCK